MKLKDKVAIITGASSGLGADMVSRFALEGAKVLAVARRFDKLEEVAAAVPRDSGEVLPFRGDLAKREDILKAIAHAVEYFGRLDILVNNAGINDNFAGVAEMDDQLWHEVFNINLHAAFHASKHAMPHLIRTQGNIVNIASIGGTEGARSGVAYTASKHALVAMTQHTAFSYATAGTRCNVICPGPVETPMVQAVRKRGSDDLNNLIDKEGAKRSHSGARNIPRIGQPHEISSVACFLASDEASLLNGAVIVADAGWTCY